MKNIFKAWSVMVILLLVLVLLTASVNAQAKESKKDSAFVQQRLRTTAEIPLFQKVNVIKKTNLNYYSLMSNYNGSREILVKEALVLEIWSNEDWQLRLNNRNLAAKIQIKKSSQNDSKWQNLNYTTAKFTGQNGVQRISFDIKFILTKRPRTEDNDLKFSLRHNIVPILY